METNSNSRSFFPFYFVHFFPSGKYFSGNGSFTGSRSPGYADDDGFLHGNLPEIILKHRGHKGLTKGTEKNFVNSVDSLWTLC